MMQERPQLSLIHHHTWPMQSSTSLVSGGERSPSLVAKHLEKKSVTPKVDAINGIHNQSTSNSKLRKDASVSTPYRVKADNGTFVAVQQQSVSTVEAPRIQWTIKNITEKDSTKTFSNLNAWLSSQKCNLEGKFGSSSSNANVHLNHSSGFDLTKLYPELSAKLGLTKSSNDGSLKYQNKSSVNGKEVSPSINFFNKSGGEGKSSGSVSAKKNISRLHKSSVQYLKPNCGKFNLGKIQHINTNLNNLSQNITFKHKDSKLNLTKLSEDKIKKLLINQQNLKKLSSSGASVITKNDLKHNSKKSKGQSVSLYESFSDKSLSRSATYPRASESSQRPNIITILPKQVKKNLSEISAKVPTPQLRVKELYQDFYAYKSDLFPLGVDHSECDVSEDEDINATKCFSFLPECITIQNEDITNSAPSQMENIFATHSTFRSQQLIMAKERLKIHEDSISQRWALTRALLEAARSNLNQTAATLSSSLIQEASEGMTKKKQRVKCNQSSLLIQRTCVYEVDEGKECAQRALPGTRHCIRHITYNVDQQLFSQCSAKGENNSLCRIPTFDVLHDPPLCEAHKQNVEEPVSCELTQPKPKRPRKKSKMPILSRYGKRSKKRRRSSLGSANSTVIPSTSVRPPINSPGVCLGSPQGTSPLTFHTSPTFSASCSAKGDGSELEDDLEGMMRVFPLEDASRLLDSGDLQDEITQILYDSGSKGDGGIGDEEEVKQPNKSCQNIAADDSKTSDNCSPLSEQTQLPIDTSALNDLANNGSIESIISSSFNQQELNTITQVLSHMVQDEGLNLENFHLIDGNNSSTHANNFDIVMKEDLQTEDYPEASLDSTDSFHPIDQSQPSPDNISDCKMSIYKETNKHKIDPLTLLPLQ